MIKEKDMLTIHQGCTVLLAPYMLAGRLAYIAMMLTITDTH